jgi:putative FmdB family regulatory protein
MPHYMYRCPECQWADEVIKPMSACNSVETCRQCHAVMERDFSAEVATSNSDTHNARPIHSDSLAIHPDQIGEHRQRYPSVDLDAACRPVFTSVKQREKYLESRGVVKVPHRREY